MADAVMCKIKKSFTLILFGCYVIFMFHVYMHYKTLIPTFETSFIKGRSYLINTDGYKLPDFNAFDKSVIRYLKETPQLDCSDGKRPLTSSTSNYFSNNTERFPTQRCAVIFYKEHQSDYTTDSVSCCYRPIEKIYNSIDKYAIKDPCTSLKDRVTLVEDNAIFVTCASESAEIYKNVHYFIQPNGTNHMSSSYDFKKSTVSKRSVIGKLDPSLNVLILGLDSVSRLNMQRYMPLTLGFLGNIDAIDLRGLNKVGENTFPNLMALLSGYLQNDASSSISSTTDLRLVWKDYEKFGYKSMYTEDCVDYDLFKSNDIKFSSPIADYNFVPYFKVSEHNIGSGGGLIWISGCHICNGPTSSLNVILDNARDACKAFYEGEQPYFSFFWSSSATHDRIHLAGLADKPISDFFEVMYNGGYWNNTIVFFLSDHGIRFGKIRETFIGRKEENLPFGYIIFPEWFKKAYPTAYENVLHNQFKLTTFLDIHETLKGILHKDYRDNYSREGIKTYSNISLFKKIPGSRTCANARIPLNYCSGIEAEEVSITPVVDKAAAALIQFVNIGLKKFPNCHQFTYYKIEKALVINFLEENSSADISHYEIQVTSYPGKAILEGVIKTISLANDKFDFKVVGGVNRLNSYRGQSYCIKDIVYRKFCLCIE